MHGYPYSDTTSVLVRNRRIPIRISGRGVPILLLHGYPLDSRMWERLIPLLASDFLCIAPDLRGFGRSQEESMSFSMSDLADDCNGILNALQIRQPTVVCGLSMGGYVAMQFADKYSERIASLILTNTRANADDAVAAANRLAVATKAINEGVPGAVIPMLEKLVGAHTKSNQPDVCDLVRTMMLETRKSTIAWAQMAMARREDFLDRMRSWRLPVTCIAGAEDSIVPLESTKLMSESILGAKLVVVENSAHMTPLECPVEFAQIVRDSVVGQS